MELLPSIDTHQGPLKAPSDAPSSLLAAVPLGSVSSFCPALDCLCGSILAQLLTQIDLAKDSETFPRSSQYCLVRASSATYTISGQDLPVLTWISPMSPQLAGMIFKYSIQPSSRFRVSVELAHWAAADLHRAAVGILRRDRHA